MVIFSASPGPHIAHLQSNSLYVQLKSVNSIQSNMVRQIEYLSTQVILNKVKSKKRNIKYSVFHFINEKADDLLNVN